MFEMVGFTCLEFSWINWPPLNVLHYKEFFLMICRYYISQHLTDKSDVYSFGVILLELISGQEAISNESFGVNCRNIVQWVSV
jgi:hypothetical protein